MPPEQPTQREYWNGPTADRWIQLQGPMDRSLASITATALALAAPRPGERVLDIGCGCGTTTFMLADRVAPGGSVVGIDISGPMIEVARARAAGAAVDFVEADAGEYRTASPFDLLFSRFGTMFFADPVAAFGNLRAALAPGGRLVFVCWRAPRDNPWACAPLVAARELLPPMEPVDPEAPGPFAFADGERLARILAAAGFTDLSVAPHDDQVFAGATVDEATEHAMVIGPLARALATAPDQVRTAIRPRVAAVMARYAGPEGVTPPAALWLVSGRR